MNDLVFLLATYQAAQYSDSGAFRLIVKFVSYIQTMYYTILIHKGYTRLDPAVHNDNSQTDMHVHINHVLTILMVHIAFVS